MGCKEDGGLGKFQQGTTANLRSHRCSGIMRMADNIRGEDSSGQARWHICETIDMDTVVEEMWDGNRRDVGQWRCRNGLEERRQTEQILTGNDYQPEGVSPLQ